MILVAARFFLFSNRSGDMNTFLLPWLQAIHDGGFKAMAGGFSDYTPPYIYLMGLFAQLRIPPETVIKLISVIFDIILAFGVMALVNSIVRKRMVAVGAFFSVLLLPTVILNSSYWGQCDVIYTGLLVFSLYYLVRNGMTNADTYLSLLFFSLAFAFKQQTVFIAPLYAVLLFRKHISWRAFLVIPGVYLLMVVPAWIAGRSLVDLLFIYVNQAGTYVGKLTLNAPNIYSFFDNNKAFSGWGLVMTAGIVAGLIIRFSLAREKLDARRIVGLAALFSMVIPFLLPHMHERYYYLADVLMLVYAFLVPGRWYLPAIVVTGSLLSYQPFLFGMTSPLPQGVIAMAFAFVIFRLAMDAFRANPVSRFGRTVMARRRARQRYLLRKKLSRW